MILKVQIIEEQKLQDGNAFVDFFLQVVTVTMSLLEEEECELKTKQQTRKGPCRYGVQGSEDDPRQVFAWDGIFRSVVSVCSTIYITAPIHYKTIRSSDGVHGT